MSIGVLILAFFLRMLRSNEHCKWVEMSHMVGIEGYVVGKSTSDNSSIMQLTRIPPSHHRIAPQQNSTHVKLARHPWMRWARQLRNNRAPGEDGIPSSCLDSLGSWLHRVISKVWWSETVLCLCILMFSSSGLYQPVDSCNIIGWIFYH